MSRSLWGRMSPVKSSSCIGNRVILRRRFPIVKPLGTVGYVGRIVSFMVGYESFLDGSRIEALRNY